MNKLYPLICCVLFGFCQVEKVGNGSDITNTENLFTSLIVFGVSAEVSFVPASATVHKQLKTIDLNFKNELLELSNNDILLYNNGSNLNFSLTRLASKSYRIEFTGIEGRIELDLSRFATKNGISFGNAPFLWTIDNQLPEIVSTNKLQKVHSIDLREGNAILSFSEAVEGAEDLSNYSISYSDPNTIQAIKILRVDNQNYRIFFDSFGTKPMQVTVTPIRVKDFAGNAVSGGSFEINVYGFRKIGSLKDKRCDGSAIALDSTRILYSGGVNLGTISSTLEIYDTSTESSRLLTAQTTKPMFYHRSFKLPNGKILLIGGFESSFLTAASDKYGIVSSETFLFDPETETIQSGPSLNTPRSNFASLQLKDGSIVVLGGMTVVSSVIADLRYSNVIEILRPGASSFETLTLVLPTTLHSHGAVELSDGKVLVFGGLINRLDSPTGYNFEAYRLDLVAQTVVGTKTLQGNLIESFFSLDGERLFLGSGFRSPNLLVYQLNSGKIENYGTLSRSLGRTNFFSDDRYYNFLSGISGNSSPGPLEKVIHLSRDFSKFVDGLSIPEPKFCNATMNLNGKVYELGGSNDYTNYIKIAGGLNLANASSDSVWVYEAK